MAETGRTLEVFSRREIPQELVGHTITAQLELTGGTNGVRWWMQFFPTQALTDSCQVALLLTRSAPLLAFVAILVLLPQSYLRAAPHEADEEDAEEDGGSPDITKRGPYHVRNGSLKNVPTRLTKYRRKRSRAVSSRS